MAYYSTPYNYNFGYSQPIILTNSIIDLVRVA